jgi:hypothetical protein
MRSERSLLSTNLQPYLRDTDTGLEWVFPIGDSGAYYRKLTREHAATILAELAKFLAKE